MADWYVLRVASNKEERIRKNLLLRIAEEGLESHFLHILVPIQKIPEIVGNQRRIIKRKMYPGYLMIQMEMTEDALNLLETIPGVSDFIGAQGKPIPMDPKEVEHVFLQMNSDEETVVLPKIQLEVGDRVRIKEGPFTNYTGEIREVVPSKGKVKVLVNKVFNYANVEMEMEYWHVEMDKGSEPEPSTNSSE